MLSTLGLDRFHLVVHDTGSPIGFDLVARASSGSRRCLGPYGTGCASPAPSRMSRATASGSSQNGR